MGGGLINKERQEGRGFFFNGRQTSCSENLCGLQLPRRISLGWRLEWLDTGYLKDNQLQIGTHAAQRLQGGDDLWFQLNRHIYKMMFLRKIQKDIVKIVQYLVIFQTEHHSPMCSWVIWFSSFIQKLLPISRCSPDNPVPWGGRIIHLGENLPAVHELRSNGVDLGCVYVTIILKVYMRMQAAFCNVKFLPGQKNILLTICLWLRTVY